MQNAGCKMQDAKPPGGERRSHFASGILHFAFYIFHLAFSDLRARCSTVFLACGLCAGCGTTKWTDTSRTATEQLLITDSMDRAVSRLDLRAVAGKKVFVDDTPLKGMTDANYLVSTLKQEVMASGGTLKEPKDQADYVLEVRAGALGTDRHDVLFGVPATTIPTIATVPGVPSQIPEIPFLKKTDQRAVTKIALFLYNRQTGRPVWQSGALPEESRAKAWWVLGAGPFQRGTIYTGTKFVPLVDLAKNPDGTRRVTVNDQAFFVEPKEEQKSTIANNKDGATVPKDQAIGGKAPANGSTPPGALSPGVVAASHTALDKASGNAPPPGPPISPSPAALAPPSPFPSGDARDRVLPLPPVEEERMRDEG
jgi:hypothetical protein